MSNQFYALQQGDALVQEVEEEDILEDVANALAILLEQDGSQL